MKSHLRCSVLDTLAAEREGTRPRTVKKRIFGNRIPTPPMSPTGQPWPGCHNPGMAPLQLTPRSRARSIRSLSFLALVALLMATLAGSAAAQADAPSPDPGALPVGFSQQMVRKAGEVIEQVHPVRGLPPAEGVAYRVIDQQTFLAELEALFHEEYPSEYIAAEDDLYTRLGLIGPDQDLEKLVLKIYDQQVLAFYDPPTKTFSLIGPIDKIGPMESIVVAHEYGHALQDAAYDLEGNRIKELDQADAILAQQALVEGDATAVMYDWAARELSLTQLLGVSADALTQQDSRRLGRIPELLRRQLEFPYIDGFAFVNAIRGRGDWDAVDDVWLAQPVSTEQILHPELYPDEQPVDIELPDVAAALGPEWTASYAQTMGEMQVGVWVADGKRRSTLFPVLPGQLPNAEAAAGWGGDRLVSLDGPDGAWAVVWQTAWDSERDQQEFRKAARAAMQDLPGAHTANDTDVVGGLSSPVLVLVADSKATLNTLRGALGLT